MYHNFIFNKLSSKMMGVMRVYFDSAEQINTMKTELETQVSENGQRFNITKNQYSEPITFKFQIINTDYSAMTAFRQIQLIEWLCKRNQFCEFSIDAKGYEDVIYNVIMTNPVPILANGVVGLEFTVTADSPYGRSHEKKQIFSSGTTNRFNINTNSSVDDYIYPIAKLTVIQNGDLTLTNISDDPNRTSIITGCITGEVITICNTVPYITLDDKSILSRFNKKWMRLINGNNTIVTNNNCFLELSYQEIKKVVIY